MILFMLSFYRHFYLTNLLLPTMKKTSIQDDTECRIINVTSSLERKAAAFLGEDLTGESSLRANLPDTVPLKDRISTQSNFWGLLNGPLWMRHGPEPYGMHLAYYNASLCILLSTFRLSRLLSTGKDIPFLGMNPHTSPELTEKGLSGGSPRVVVNALCPGLVNTELYQDSMMWNIVRRMFRSPQHSAQHIVGMAISSECDGLSGQLFGVVEDSYPSIMAKSARMEDMVWKESFKLVRELQQIELDNLSKSSDQ